MSINFERLDDAFLLALIEAQEELADDERLGNLDPSPRMVVDAVNNLRERLAREEKDGLLVLRHSLDAAIDMDPSDRLSFYAPTTADVDRAKRNLTRALSGNLRRRGRAGRETQKRAGSIVRSLASVSAVSRVSATVGRAAHSRVSAYRASGDFAPAAPRVRTIESAPLPGPPELGAAEDWRTSIRSSVGTAAGWEMATTPSADVVSDELRRISRLLEAEKAEPVIPPGRTEAAHNTPGVKLPVEFSLPSDGAPRFGGFRRFVKASFDCVVAATALLLLSPILVVIGIIIRATSRGPALFRQTRVGRNGKLFRMIKFRTMYIDGDSRLAELIADRDVSNGLTLKVPADPRVTPVGRVLRKFSLDEFPQLINVLIGSMSIVGPRPPLPNEVSRYRDDLRRRLLVKPGCTGLWQVSGRSDLSWDEAVRLNLRYIDNWSLAMDLRICWKTFRTMVRGVGAY